MNGLKRLVVLSALLGTALGFDGQVRAADTSALKTRLSSVEYDQAGHLVKGYLKQPAVVDGLPCQRWIRFRADQSVSMCQLSSDTTIQGQLIPEGSSVWFHANGRPCRVWLAREMIIQGVPCAGAPDKKAATAFYPNGRLEVTFLPRAATIQGVPCKSTGLGPVYLFPSGKLKMCVLDREATINGQAYSKDKQLTFDEHGRVIKAEDLPGYWARWGQVIRHNKKKWEMKRAAKKAAEAQQKAGAKK